MYFPVIVYSKAIEDYALVMKKNPSSVKTYMFRNPEWALEVAVLFLDKYYNVGKVKYPEMKALT
jgi:hypothetical protein